MQTLTLNNMTYEEQIEQWYLSADSAFGLRSKDIEALAKILIASQGQEQLPIMNRKMRLVYWAYNAWMVTKPELPKTEENGEELVFDKKYYYEPNTWRLEVVSLNTLKEDIATLEELGVTHIEFNDTDFSALTQRLETDEELKVRELRNKQYEEYLVAKKREEYERLKKEFENG